MKGTARSDSSGIHISWARCEDLPQVAGIIDEGFVDKFAPAYGCVSAVRLSCVRIILENRGMDWHQMLVAKIGDRVVGFSILTWKGTKACTNEWLCIRHLAARLGWIKAIWGSAKMMLLEYGGPDEKECDVYMFGVAGALRRKGIGKALLAASEAVARERGCTSLTLHVTLNNTGAIQFYQSVGFQVSRTWKSKIIECFFGIRGYHAMQKNLGEAHRKPRRERGVGQAVSAQ